METAINLQSLKIPFTECGGKYTPKVKAMENVAFVRLMGVEPNPLIRLFNGGRSSNTLTIEEIATRLKRAGLIANETEALREAIDLVDRKFDIGPYAGSIWTLSLREYSFKRRDESSERFELAPEHYSPAR
jgi:hypothetical protein